MNYSFWKRCVAVIVAGTTVSAGTGLRAAMITSDPPPITAGLFVELNGENLTTAAALSIWTDQQSSSPGTFQNFVQSDAFRQPSAVLNHVMPNSLEANVVNFARGPYSANQNSNNNANSTRTDFLRSVAGGDNNSTTIGTDTAYELNKLTYFVVFQLNLADTNTDRRPQQSVLSSDYTDVSSAYATVTHNAGYDANGGPLTAGGQPDLYSAVRGNPGATELGAGVADVPVGTWYIAATSWDTDSGDARMVLYDHLGNVTERSLNTGSFVDGLDGHLNTSLGAGTNTGGSGTRMQGLEGNIAELLMYDTALGTTDMNKVINYLNTKYFGAATVLPEGALTGDHNGDGTVDAADYVTWRKTNINGDQGYLDWRSHFGESNMASGGALSPSHVPEPTAPALIGLVAFCAVFCGARRRAAL
jgi:hypothetical protein